MSGAHREAGTVDPVQQRLAQYCADFRFADLPAPVVHCAKALTVDTLGVAIAGFADEPCARLQIGRAHV